MLVASNAVNHQVPKPGTACVARYLNQILMDFNQVVLFAHLGQVLERQLVFIQHLKCELWPVFVFFFVYSSTINNTKPSVWWKVFWTL